MKKTNLFDMYIFFTYVFQIKAFFLTGASNHRPSLKSLATPIALNSASKGPRPLINKGSTEKKQGCKPGFLVSGEAAQNYY